MFIESRSSYKKIDEVDRVFWGNLQKPKYQIPPSIFLFINTDENPDKCVKSYFLGPQRP